MDTRIFLLVAAMSLTAMSGCLDSDGNAKVDDIQTGATAADLDASPGSGTARSHKEPSVDETTPETEVVATGYRASKTVTISNDFGGARFSDGAFATDNGAIAIVAGSDGGYVFTVEVWADGRTEDQALSNLNALQVINEDSLQGDTLHLGVHIEDGNNQGDVLSLLLGGFGGHGANIHVLLPRAPLHEISAATSNGPIHIDDIRGSKVQAMTSNGAIHLSDLLAKSVEAQTSNGGIAFEGAADQLALATSSGSIDATGNVGDVGLATSNGEISGRFTPSRSGAIQAGTSNGHVDLRLTADADHAYDVTASTSNGRVTIDLPDASVTQETDSIATARTLDFDLRPIQTQVEVATDNASITIEGQ